MKIIQPSAEIIDLDRAKILKNIELAARTCYKSEDKICEGSVIKLIKMLLIFVPENSPTS